MCRKAYRHEQMAPVPAGAYEGPTTRFDWDGRPEPEQRRAGWQRSFPWWSLWLIWPLIGLLRWAAPLYLGALAALRESIGMPSQPATMLLAAALIVAGAALIWRR